MTVELKHEIRRRIYEATGSDLGEFHTECLLTDKSGRVGISVTSHEKATRKMKFAAISETGQLAPFNAEVFCN